MKYQNVPVFPVFRRQLGGQHRQEPIAANTLIWVRIIPVAHRTPKPGGRLIIRFQGAGQDGELIMPLLKWLNFKEINDRDEKGKRKGKKGEKR